MSYTDPVRLYFKGDRVVAARYVKDGRRLLWQLARQTAESGVASARRIYKLTDDVTIEIILAGLQAAIVIDVRTGEEKRVQIVEHFVTYPRTEALPDGIDPKLPVTMLFQAKKVRTAATSGRSLSPTGSYTTAISTGSAPTASG